MTEGWKEKLHQAVRGHTMVVVVGLGSVLRGDDGFGVVAAQAIREKVTSSRLRVLEAGTVPENYLGAVRTAAPSLVVLLDAAHMGKQAGHIDLLPREHLESMSSSTHNMSLGMLADYLVDEMGCQVMALGAQPKCTGLGAQVSPEVMDAVCSVVDVFRSSFG